MFSYGEYDFMYPYTSGSCSGSPHSSHSVTVSGRDGSRMLVSASTNGTWATTAPHASGAMFTAAPTSRPPAEPPRATRRGGADFPRRPPRRAAARAAARAQPARRRPALVGQVPRARDEVGEGVDLAEHLAVVIPPAAHLAPPPEVDGRAPDPQD